MNSSTFFSISVLPNTVILKVVEQQVKMYFPLSGTLHNGYGLALSQLQYSYSQNGIRDAGHLLFTLFFASFLQQQLLKLFPNNTHLIYSTFNN